MMALIAVRSFAASPEVTLHPHDIEPPLPRDHLSDPTIPRGPSPSTLSQSTARPFSSVNSRAPVQFQSTLPLSLVRT
ncbi:hypothetical protein T484DRAFT_1941550 [Baffinella frigidus]|nr:hypothetical protein T484DRAFT_1941550 [Cryptophyta sp. CCMP2293]